MLAVTRWRHCADWNRPGIECRSHSTNNDDVATTPTVICTLNRILVVDSHGKPQVPDMENGNQTSRNGTEQEPHDDEEEHHISRHAVVWPSTLGMMIFIALSGYLFYHFYSK